MNESKFYCPTNVICGSGALNNLTEMTKNLGDKCLFIMDPFFAGSDLEKRIISLMPGKEVISYAKVTPNPRTADIDEGAKQENISFIIALGGGSSMDTAKAINFVYTNGGCSWDYTSATNRATRPIVKPILPLIAIPTTSGTGSEVTRFSVITNSETHAKGSIRTDLCFPYASIVDPELMFTVPRKTTALTGIDAFAHCFEAYIRSNSNVFADMFAFRGMELFAENIEKVCEDGTDVEARNNMALCSTLGGISISHSATTLPHAIGQAFSGATDAPHGGAIAVFMTEIIKWTLPNAKERIAKVACLFDKTLVNKTIDEQANALPQILDNLFTKIIGTKVTMKDFGMTEDKIEYVADLALTNFSGGVAGHPRVANKEEIIEIIKKCM